MQIQFSSNEDTHVLVVRGGDSQSEMVAVPIQGVDWLRADDHALQPLQFARNAAGNSLAVDAVSLLGVFTENGFIKFWLKE